jgi:hypothetical protein
VPDTLILTLTSGENARLEVDDGAAELERFLSGHGLYDQEWIRVDDQQLVRRAAIVSVRIASEGPLVRHGDL